MIQTPISNSVSLSCTRLLRVHRLAEGTDIDYFHSFSPFYKVTALLCTPTFLNLHTDRLLRAHSTNVLPKATVRACASDTLSTDPEHKNFGCINSSAT